MPAANAFACADVVIESCATCRTQVAESTPAGVAILAGVLARLAAILEASMLTAFALLVWVAPVIAKPSDVNLWVELIVTVAVASGVWAVASRLRSP